MLKELKLTLMVAGVKRAESKVQTVQEVCRKTTVLLGSNISMTTHHVCSVK